MLEFEVVGQKLTMTSEIDVISDTIQYITAKFSFSRDWAGLRKVAHFKCDDTVYDIVLTNNSVLASDNLNLYAGVWEIYVHGSDDMRITTSSVYLTVEQSGILDGEPLPEIPLTAAEQILNIAQSVRDDADAGVFDGESAGFGTPTAEISSLPAGSDPQVTIETTGPDIAKIFHFSFAVAGSDISPATSSTIGGIIVGDGLTVDEDGVVSIDWIEV